MVEIELRTPLDFTQKSFPSCILVIATANKISQCVVDQDQSLRQRQVCPVARWKQPCQSPYQSNKEAQYCHVILPAISKPTEVIHLNPAIVLKQGDSYFQNLWSVFYVLIVMLIYHSV